MNFHTGNPLITHFDHTVQPHQCQQLILGQGYVNLGATFRTTAHKKAKGMLRAVLHHEGLCLSLKLHSHKQRRLAGNLHLDAIQVRRHLHRIDTLGIGDGMRHTLAAFSDVKQTHRHIRHHRAIQGHCTRQRHQRNRIRRRQRHINLGPTFRTRIHEKRKSILRVLRHHDGLRARIINVHTQEQRRLARYLNTYFI